MRKPPVYKEYEVIEDIPNTDIKAGRVIRQKESSYKRLKNYLKPVEVKKKSTGKGSKK